MSQRRYELTDFVWSIIEPLSPDGKWLAAGGGLRRAVA